MSQYTGASANGNQYSVVRPESLAAVPAPIDVTSRCLLWKYERRGKSKKPTKPPLNSVGNKVSTYEEQHWLDPEQALDLAHERDLGIGFVLGDDFWGIDFDNCRDAKTGRVTSAEARELLRPFRDRHYIEKSPSGTGFKIFGRGELPIDLLATKESKDGSTYVDFAQNNFECDGFSIECYCSDRRYFTVTGERVAGSAAQLSHRTDEVVKLYRDVRDRYGESSQKESPGSEETVSPPYEESDPEGEAAILRAIAAMVAMDMVDVTDGSRRLYASACRAKEYNLSESAALAAIERYAEEHPFLGRFSSDQVARRIRDAERSPDVVRGLRDPRCSFYEPAGENSSAEGAPSKSKWDKWDEKWVGIDDLPEGEDVDYVWEHVVAPGLVTVLFGLPKKGKSTVIGHFIREAAEGGELGGLYVKKCRVLYITEEPEPVLRKRRETLGLTKESMDVLQFPFPTGKAASDAEWKDFFRYLVDRAKGRNIDVIVIDTLAAMAPFKDENDAASVQAAFGPIKLLASAGLAVLIVHHRRKSGGPDDVAGRGSGAIMGASDINVTFREMSKSKSKKKQEEDGEEVDDRRRKLNIQGRLGTTSRIIQLSECEQFYEEVGDRRERREEQAALLKIARAIIPADGNGIDTKTIRDQWPDPKPSRTTLQRRLRQWCNEQIMRVVNPDAPKNEPKRYLQVVYDFED